MKTSLTVFLFGVGLVLFTTSSAFAQGNALPVGSGTAARARNADTTTATLNTGGATLAGVIALLLLQRKFRANPVPMSKP